MERPVKWLTLAFIAFMAAVVLLADRGQLPGFITALYAFPEGDKVGHFVLFGILAFLLNNSVSLAPPHRPWLNLVAASLALAAAAANEEASQSLFVNRHASWQDLASSCAGILCFAYLAWFIRRRRTAQLVSSAFPTLLSSKGRFFLPSWSWIAPPSLQTSPSSSSYTRTRTVKSIWSTWRISSRRSRLEILLTGSNPPSRRAGRGQGEGQQ